MDFEEDFDDWNRESLEALAHRWGIKAPHKLSDDTLKNELSQVPSPSFLREKHIKRNLIFFTKRFDPSDLICPIFDQVLGTKPVVESVDEEAPEKTNEGSLFLFLTLI